MIYYLLHLNVYKGPGLSDGYLCDSSPLFPACHIEFCRSALNFPWAADPGARGPVLAGPPQWQGEIWQDLALSKLHFSQMETAPLHAANGLALFFPLTEWGNRWHHGCGANGCGFNERWWLFEKYQAFDLCLNPLVMSKINFDCCSWWSMRLRAISYSCRGGRLWRLIEHRLD